MSESDDPSGSRWHATLVYFGLRDDPERRDRFEQEPMGPWRWLAVLVTLGVLLGLILIGLGVIVQWLGAAIGLLVVMGTVRTLLASRRK